MDPKLPVICLDESPIQLIGVASHPISAAPGRPEGYDYECRRSGTANLFVFVDAHRDDPIGVLKLETADFAEVAARLKALGLPTIVVQEGGYAIDAIGGCLDACLDGFGA